MLFTHFSLLTSFIAGALALFAPCCIGFLLPSYLGTVFKERTRVVALTAVFALGIFVVFLPIGLGFGAIGMWLTRFHDQFFYLGSLMLIVFGVMLLFGRMPMLHLPLRNRQSDTITVGSIFLMGIFSGIGSACCAPVFAGVVTLSALSATPLGGVLLAGAYVLGMVTPLFAISWAIDRSRALERFSLLQKRVSWRIAFVHGDTIIAHVAAGIIFVVAGALIAWLTYEGMVMSVVSWRDTVQVGWAQALEQKIPWLGILPDSFWFVALMIALVVIARAVWRQRKAKNN